MKKSAANFWVNLCKIQKAKTLKTPQLILPFYNL